MRKLSVLLVICVFITLFIVGSSFAENFPLDINKFSPVYRQNEETTTTFTGFQGKNPLYAGILSFVIPSTGHIYAGQWNRGISFAFFESVGYFIYKADMNKEMNTVGIVWLVGAHIWQVVDVLQVTTKGYSDFSWDYNPETRGVQVAYRLKF